MSSELLTAAPKACLRVVHLCLGSKSGPRTRPDDLRKPLVIHQRFPLLHLTQGAMKLERGTSLNPYFRTETCPKNGLEVKRLARNL